MEMHLPGCHVRRLAVFLVDFYEILTNIGRNGRRFVTLSLSGLALYIEKTQLRTVRGQGLFESVCLSCLVVCLLERRC